MDAARAEFSSKGFHGARVDAIAAKAGVNKQRLYANFGSKAGLFKEILKASFADLVEAERRLLVLDEQDIPNLPGIILRCYVDIHEKHPEFWRLLAWENLDGGHHANVLEGLQNPIFSHLRRLYAMGQEAGHYRTDVAFDAFLFGLLSASFFMASNRHTLKKTIGLDLSRPRLRQILCRDLVRQIATGKDAGTTVNGRLQ